MWTYNHTEEMYHKNTENSDELYHYGVKGMKWGVRRSQEVQSVNKAYKKELRGLKNERNKQNAKNFGKAWGTNLLSPVRVGDVQYVKDTIANNKNYKEKKKALQEKYEPDFQKAKKDAEERLSSPAEVQKRANRVNTGKKVAAGLLAAAGATAAVALVSHVRKNKDIYSRSGILAGRTLSLMMGDKMSLYSAFKQTAHEMRFEGL